MDYPNHLSEILAPSHGFMYLPEEHADFRQARVVIVPVPFDGTTCYRPGTREGPEAIIAASRNLELYDHELRRSPYELGIHTLRAVDTLAGDAQAMVDRIEDVTSRLLEASKFIVTLGGDHLTSIGIVRAFARRYSGMSVLQIDAHADLREEYEGSPLSSATVMRRVLDVCPRTAQVGIRSLSAPEAQLVEERRLPVWFAEEICSQTRRGQRSWIESIMSVLSEDVYITIDVDAFDPSLLPGTGTPEPGGLGWYDVIDLITTVAQEKKVIGADVVELSPLIEDHVSPMVAAKLVYKLIGLAVHETDEHDAHPDVANADKGRTAGD